MRTRAEVTFRGKVQGVHFRDYTRRFSKRQHVTGWVMNMPDGSVRALFEGEKLDIEEVVRLLREEHPHARVDRVEVKWGECTGEFCEFKIK
jgi:acylphosphatase